jgi:hypothetical protein
MLFPKLLAALKKYCKAAIHKPLPANPAGLS